jgi:hypothetical protein
MSYFPPLQGPDLVPFRSLRDQLLKDPDILFQDDCPYDQKTIDFLIEILVPTSIEGMGAIESEEIEDVFEETKQMYQKLKASGNKIKENDTKEKMSYFSTATRLLKELTAMMERNQGIKEYTEFQAKVLDILDRVLTKDQRQQVIDDIGLELESDE